MRIQHLFGALCLILCCGCIAKRAPRWTFVLHSGSSPDPGVSWPWKGAVESHPFKGVSRWTASTNDYTSLELFRFDFSANPRLRFGMYDQDEDDAKPFDDQVDFYPYGIGWVTQHLNSSFSSKRRILLAWNGLFFAFRRVPGSPPHGWANHIGPIVLDGKAHYNVGEHRWMFGAKYDAGERPHFKAVFKPGWKELSTQFNIAADGAQCVVRDGEPLQLPPPSYPSLARPAHAMSSTAEDVGQIPIVDDIKTSRTSIGWSKDSRYMYVLIVSEPDTETSSINAFRKHYAQVGGWSLADLQEFWMSLHVWGAINSDGGLETQRTLLQQDGSYDLLTPQIGAPAKHIKLAKDLSNAPPGGTLMSFFVSG